MRAAVVVVTIIVSTHSHAQATPTPSTAEDFFNAGQAAYDRGDYALAIDHWQVAYRLSNEPALLYNIAQAQRLAGDCARALSSYQQFIVGDPTSERLPLAKDFVRELAAECGSPKPRVSPDPVTITRSGRVLKIAGLVTSSAGVSLVAGGLALGKHASTLADRVSAACAVSCDWAAQRDTDAAGRRDAVIAYALDAIGLTGVVSGVVMLHLGHRGTLTVTPRSHDGGAILSWSGSW
jgi:hypothetical protein